MKFFFLCFHFMGIDGNNMPGWIEGWATIGEEVVAFSDD